MLRRSILIGWLIPLAGIYAQPGRGPERAGGGPEMAGRGFRILGAQPGRPGPVVKGAPYTADVTTEITETLADGNKIHQSTAERVYRDSEGRTRRETSLAVLGGGSNAAAPQLAFIDDPVGGASYALDLTNHTATRMPFRPPPPGGGRGQNRSQPRVEGANTRTESLGRQTIAGVPADGTRVTRTIPAGQIGNTLPIQIVNERWYSPDLQTVVLEKRSDPRSGEMVYQLNNIIRSDPSPTLFAPSAEFQVTQQGPGMRRRQGGPPR